MIKAIAFVFHASFVKVNNRQFLLLVVEFSVERLRVVQRTSRYLEHCHDRLAKKKFKKMIQLL